MAESPSRSQADEGSEQSVNTANLHFFRPNDGIYVSDGPEQRTICVSPHLPGAMVRSNGEWHVEQFELHKELYRGKTSLLYMATDRISGVQVALKLYRKRKLSVLNRYQVEREVRLHINLHHENIIHLFAAFEDEKHVYMVQEFAVCGDLFEDLKKGGGQLKEKYAVRDVIVPFLSALAYLHSQGIIHRDIKPENILLGANKTIKVADFGLSININHERPVTRAGTLDYMAPEVLVCPDKRRPEENKDKVDSWAVGILAYELLVGYPPFEQESRAATYEHIMYKDPKYPSWMTEEAKKFIGLALCKNASQRPTIFDLMQHAWVQPYVVRQPSTGASTNPGPSRLRNSVSLMSEERDGPVRSSVNGMGPPTSSSSMAPVPPAASRTLMQQSSVNSNHGGGQDGAPPKPPVQLRSPQNAVLKTSASLQPQAMPGSQEPITGADGRLHDSISDPTIRSFEAQNPHPPGAASAASLRLGTGPRSGGGADMERSGSVASSASISGGGAPPRTVAPPRHRMASFIPPVNTSVSSSVSGAAASLRMPAPPLSPKPLVREEVAPGFHRPASGVLSDDTFLPPARAPSMSFGGQHLSPLQAALLAPRPSSRLNSPSHSRRNSVSQAGAVPVPPLPTAAAQLAALQGHASTPLPLLAFPDYGDQAMDDTRVSTSSHHKHGGGGSAGKMFGKLWPGSKDAAGGGADRDGPLEVSPSSGASFTSRSGGANASAMARSAAAARVRMMAPEDLRPLMRESSISSSTHKSSGGINLRDELSQQSMTVYHRPGKVPGVGRAALAARDADGPDSGGREGNGLGKTKSLVNRNLNGVLGDDGHQLARLGSDAALARTAAAASVAAGAGSGPSVASQRSFTSGNSAFARKLANGAIATKVTEYVKGRLPHDEDMEG
ncbi:hypothetical protein GPECTOR_17g1004 [Gonium pectorale]|uniref:Protein kinase domain-containing protein n=1 Tax=Gonium pectorale TaxID=33097 RepID=A0A150GJZ9_GONPE|nr:hypothetical protein GPECTOR_17g1004 [Gonium pectorale]|eukprot:KXZ50131.1 hypothetical protein GPECTOR_17g1004 [Gonium pectorale]